MLHDELLTPTVLFAGGPLACKVSNVTGDFTISAMANWRDEYFAALRIRDEREKSHSRLFDACTRLPGIDLWNT